MKAYRGRGDKLYALLTSALDADEQSVSPFGFSIVSSLARSWVGPTAGLGTALDGPHCRSGGGVGWDPLPVSDRGWWSPTADLGTKVT
jgi:hypothetical protein